MAGLSHTPEDTTLRLEYDLEIYDRAREGGEQHTYKFLTASIAELLTRGRIERGWRGLLGIKYGAAASPRVSRPQEEVAEVDPEAPKRPGQGFRKKQDPITQQVKIFKPNGRMLRLPERNMQAR